MPFSTEITMLIVALVSTMGGFIHGSTGFGYGIFVMIFFPNILPYLTGVGLSSMISMFGQFGIVYKFRKHIRWKLIFLPIIFYLVTSAVCINLSMNMDTSFLKGYLGAFLVILAIYFMFFNGKIKIKPNLPTAAVVGVMSGMLSGFFAIGGPPMVIYYLSATDTKEQYFGTCQTFFFLTGIYNTLIRVFKGIITAEILPLFFAGYAAMMLGIFVAGKVVEKINSNQLKKMVYGVIALSGVWMIVSNI